MKVHMLVALAVLGCSLSLSSQELTLHAGQLFQCTLEEPNLSSASALVGEPVVCYLQQFREFGRAAFPRGSYLTGRFTDYREPGRLVGKGWLTLQFDRLILPDTEIPISSRVVSVRGFRMAAGGYIEGRGHATRDAFAWSLPFLWPVQLLRLPGRGPRPTLRGELAITLRLLDDVTLPYCEPRPSRFVPRPPVEALR
jgi:hypothetical protein